MICHLFLVELCEVIIYGSEHYPLYSNGFSANDKKDAAAYLKSLESFSFVYALVTLYHVLSYFSSPMKVLQSISQDLFSGMKLIQDCQRELVVICTSDKELQEFSERICSHSCRLSAKSDITPGIPRICQRQSHRSNFQSSDPMDYKVTVLLPFIDHIIADIESRFTKHTQKVAHLANISNPRIVIC